MKKASASSRALGLGIAFGIGVSACSSTVIVRETTPDGGVTSGSDAGTGGGALSFAPSNLGSYLATIDTSTLPDIDVTGTSNELGISCGAANPPCVSGTVTQSDGSSATVYVAKSWKLEPNSLLPSKDSLPTIIVATGTITILGRLDASATGQSTVTGGYTPASPGPGAGGNSVEGDGTTTSGVAAGGAGHCGVGGAGGAATASAGAGGKPYGTATLIPLTGGSAGGTCGLASGAGGGALELVAGVSITVGAGGAISAGGAGGDDGDGSYASCAGGAGGAILLEAPTVTIAGIVEANGGGGGGGATGASGNVSNANPNGTAAVGLLPGTSGAGGNGSAGAATAGAAGGAGDAAGGANIPGGGGGGAGWIRINTTTGAATVTGTVSPALGSCATQGTLAH